MRVVEEPWRQVVRCRIAESARFNIVSGPVVLSDDIYGISSLIDAVVEYNGARAIVKYRHSTEDSVYDETEMAVAMFLSGVWNGFMVKVDGDEVKGVSFASPSRKDVMEILDSILSLSKEVSIQSISGSVFPAVPGRHCLCCPIREGCAQKETSEAGCE